ncbi:MAG: hypothetical protein RIS63_586, partial [Bacteroidota bacterium]
MGCANSLILMELQRNGLLEQKRIVVYEPEHKKSNDRTFCFWLTPEQLLEAGLEQLVSHSWSAVQVNDLAAQSLEGKRYYYLRADALYAHASQILSQYQVTFHAELLKDYPSELAHFVFDSRPPHFELNTSLDVQISQSFYGWLVKTEAPIFDPEVFTMMDFSIAQHGQTQFLYVLPFDSREALIEPTRFGQAQISEQDAAAVITNFLKEKHTEFQILEKEQGCIPMCSAALKNEDLPLNWYRTGAGGGQLKPSTGYSFVRSLTDAQHIVESLSLRTTKLKRRKSPARFAYYDRLLLKILAQKPQKGKEIFTKLFRHNEASKVLNFLDEQTTPLQEIRLMSTLPILLFLNAAFTDLLAKALAFLKKRSIALYITLVFLVLEQFHLGILINSMLIVGLFTIGIPHGALDHLYSVNNKFRIPWNFIFIYLGLGLLILLLWWLFPAAALLVFLTYTAWHFGQADFEIWNLSSGLKSFFWGSMALAMILGSHWTQTTLILKEMGITIPLTYRLKMESDYLWQISLSLILFLPKQVIQSSKKETILMLIIGAWLPLLPAFGCYFIYQHSLHGWLHL